MRRHKEGEKDVENRRNSESVSWQHTVEDDAELSALIKAIDSGSATLTGTGYEVNQTDFDRVKEARNFCYLGAEGSNACIVNSSEVNSGLAKLFLKYLYSDDGIKNFAYSKCGAIIYYSTTKRLNQ